MEASRQLFLPVHHLIELLSHQLLLLVMLLPLRHGISRFKLLLSLGSSHINLDLAFRSLGRSFLRFLLQGSTLVTLLLLLVSILVTLLLIPGELDQQLA